MTDPHAHHFRVPHPVWMIVCGVLLLVMLLAGVAISPALQYHRERVAMTMIAAAGGYVGVTNVGPPVLKQSGVVLFDRIETAYLAGSSVRDGDLALMRDLTELRVFDLDDTRVTGVGLRHLAGMQIEVLSLARTAVTDQDLEHLTQMPLRALSLSGTGVTDAGVHQLDHMPTLEWLDISDTRVTLDAVVSLKITGLGIGGSSMAEGSLQRLAREMPVLESLTLTGVPPSSDGVAAISKLPRLKRLYLERMVVPDEVLSDLEVLTGLKDLVLPHRVSSDAVGRLRLALPSCKLFWRPDPLSPIIEPL